MRRFRALRFALLPLAVVLVSAAAAQEVDPRDPTPHDPAHNELNSGVDAFKAARYSEAAAHFRKAVELDPQLPMAKTYLATALAQHVVPGLQTPDNLKTAQESVDIFEHVLAADPHDVNSRKQIAAIYFSINKWDDAREWQKKVLAEDPRDAEAAFTVGVIDWTVAYKNAKGALQAAGLTDDGEGNTKAPANVLAAIKEKNAALVGEAISYLQRAIENRPNYADAMVYMNLTYRRKADIDSADDVVRRDDVEQARKWASMAMNARKASEERAIGSNPQQ